MIFPKHTQYVFAGKSAIALVLEFLRERGVLRDKSGQVLVPEWIGTWVYMTMHNFCFPTTVMNKKVRALMVYHQWGFPQRMDKIMPFARKHKLFLIEDCAHAIAGSYRGKWLGAFGDASVWSLSKFFNTPAGGALYTKNKELRKFVASAIRRSSPALGRETLKILQTGDAARAYVLYDRLAQISKGALASVNTCALRCGGGKRKNFCKTARSCRGKCLSFAAKITQKSRRLCKKPDWRAGYITLTSTATCSSPALWSAPLCRATTA